MARKRRPKRPDSRQLQAAVTPHWRWRTLPVWLALTGGFVAGWYVAAFGAGRHPGGTAYIILVIALVGFAIGLSQITSWLTRRWMLRRRARAAATAPRPAPPSKGPRTQA